MVLYVLVYFWSRWRTTLRFLGSKHGNSPRMGARKAVSVLALIFVAMLIKRDYSLIKRWWKETERQKKTIPRLAPIPYNANQRVEVKRSREKGAIPFRGFDEQERPWKGKLTTGAWIVRGTADFDGGAPAESRVLTAAERNAGAREYEQSKKRALPIIIAIPK